MSGADEGGGGGLVLTAIPEERSAIERALTEAQLPAHVIATGDGGVRAARVAREAIAAIRPSAVIGAGVAGGLSPDLSPSDVVVSVRVRDAAEDAPPPDADLVRRALSLSGVRGATLFSVVRPALSVSQKRALLGQLEPPRTQAATQGATGTVGCVDMESASWARACASAGVPYVILRAISDTADEDLPGYLAACMDAEGSIRRSAVARGAVFHPGAIPALLRMRRRVAECGRALGEAVAGLVIALPSR